MKKTLFTLAMLSAAILFAGSVKADTITAVVGGSAESGAIYVNFDSLPALQNAPYTSGALTVDFGGASVTADSANTAGSNPPLLSGNNNLYFGSIYSGGDNTTYLADGNQGQNGTITFNFSSAQNYFGLLWGSVDANNTLTFYSGLNGTGSVINTVTGAELNTINPVVAQTGFGDQYDPWGTAYANVNTIATFQSVVATTGTFTFEIDNVAYALVPVPEPASMGILLLAGLSSLVLIGKNWRKQTVR
jgi:hypothetical protein